MRQSIQRLNSLLKRPYNNALNIRVLMINKTAMNNREQVIEQFKSICARLELELEVVTNDEFYILMESGEYETYTLYITFDAVEELAEEYGVAVGHTLYSALGYWSSISPIIPHLPAYYERVYHQTRALYELGYEHEVFTECRICCEEQEHMNYCQHCGNELCRACHKTVSRCPYCRKEWIEGVEAVKRLQQEIEEGQAQIEYLRQRIAELSQQ